MIFCTIQYTYIVLLNVAIYLHILYTYVLQSIVAFTAPITEESSTKSWTLVQMVTTANTEKSNTKGT